MTEDPGTALVVVEQEAVQLGTLRANDPAQLVAAATAIATPLAKLIKDKQLSSKISGKEFVRCEGWTTLAAMLGVTPHEVSVTCADGVYTATVELRRLSDGVAVSRASAECGAERPWNTRDLYARRSMALTRATGKAARLAFSWIMVLAGYEATPAEEMPREAIEAGEVEDKIGGPETVWPYGKNQGKKLSELPDDFLAWGVGEGRKFGDRTAEWQDALREEMERRRVAALDSMPAALDRPDAGDLALVGTKV